MNKTNFSFVAIIADLSIMYSTVLKALQLVNHGITSGIIKLPEAYEDLRGYSNRLTSSIKLLEHMETDILDADSWVQAHWITMIRMEVYQLSSIVYKATAACFIISRAEPTYVNLPPNPLEVENTLEEAKKVVESITKICQKAVAASA